MKTRWIVVADAGRALVVSTDDRAMNLAVVKELDHPEGRLRTQDLVSDEPGRNYKGARGILSAADPDTDAHEEVAREFAQKLAKLLDEAVAHHKFEAVTLVAPAHFLGLLKASLTTQTAKRLNGAVAKDLTKLPLHELREHLEQILEFPQTP